MKIDPEQNSKYFALQKQMKQDNENLDILKKDIRKTHFNLGGDKINYVSHAGNTMVEHPITAEATTKNT